MVTQKRLTCPTILAALLLGFSTSSLLHSQSVQDDTALHRQRVEAALRANDRAAAEHEYREILALNPRSSEAWTGLGVLLYGSGRAEEAREDLQKALVIDPTANHAELFLALSKADLRDCSAAMPVLSQYFSHQPVGNLQRLTGLAMLGCASGSADTLLALRTAVRLQQLYPGDADVLYASAELYTRLWNQSAGELLQRHPDSYRVHELAGEVYEAQKNYSQAIREYALAIAANPKVPQLHFRIGQMYLQLGSPDADDKAMEQFHLEKLVNPDSAVSDLAMAEIDRHQHRLDDAKPLYEEAAGLDPSLVQARVGLAQTLLTQHQIDGAVKELEAVILKYPENASAHYTLMLAYREQGKMAEAASEMTTFQKLQAENEEQFQNKLNSLLNTQQKGGETSPK